VFALIWLYFCMLIVFFGAELNALIALRKSSKDAGSDVKKIEN
jgi:uncharacterized BrkB/YihY/UPF0761 family membrane protein